MRAHEKKIRLALRRGTQAASQRGFTPTSPRPLEPRPGGAFAIVGGDTLRPPPPLPAPPREPPSSSAGETAASGKGAGVDDATAAAAAVGGATALAREAADPLPREVELAYLVHKAGARMSPFVDDSAQDLRGWMKQGKLKGPWSVRYGKDGRPRWMKRVLPELRPTASAAAAAAAAEEEGIKAGEEEKGAEDEGHS